MQENEVNRLLEADQMAIDIESKDPDLMERGPGTHRGEGFICGLSVGCEGFSDYLSLRHPDTETDETERNKRIITELLKSPHQKVGTNLMYDLEWLEYEGYTIKGERQDVQYAEPLIDEYRRSYALSSLAKKYSSQRKATNVLEDYNSMMGWGGKAINNIWRMPSRIAGEYAKVDAELPLEIFKKQKRILETENLWEVYRMEMDLIPLMLQMRRQGVRLDMDLMKRTTQQVTDKHFQLKEQIFEWSRYEFNPSASGQLAKVFDAKKIAYPRNKPTTKMAEKGLPGNPNLDKMALAAMTKLDPICATILEYRHYDTIINMFLQPYLELAVDGRLYGSLHPLRSDKYGTVSGRFSASKPNLQQVSAADEDGEEDTAMRGRIIRSLFIPEEGHKWAKADYSQVEYRIMAHYASGRGSEELREKYKADKNTDFHKLIQEQTGVDRRTAKRLNFGGAYGMGVNTTAELFGWTMEEAEDFMNTYHANAPYVKATRKAVAAVCSRRGYIFTLLGRKARIHSSRKLHSMFNRLIQGSAADVMKKAMVNSYEAGLYNVLKPHLTVHDELDVSYKDNSEGRDALRELVHIMETCVELSVPLLVDCHVGKNWAEAD